MQTNRPRNAVNAPPQKHPLLPPIISPLLLTRHLRRPDQRLVLKPHHQSLANSRMSCPISSDTASWNGWCLTAKKMDPNCWKLAQSVSYPKTLGDPKTQILQGRAAIGRSMKTSWLRMSNRTTRTTSIYIRAPATESRSTWLKRTWSWKEGRSVSGFPSFIRWSYLRSRLFAKPVSVLTAVC